MRMIVCRVCCWRNGHNNRCRRPRCTTKTQCRQPARRTWMSKTPLHHCSNTSVAWCTRYTRHTSLAPRSRRTASPTPRGPRSCSGMILATRNASRRRGSSGSPSRCRISAASTSKATFLALSTHYLVGCVRSATESRARRLSAPRPECSPRRGDTTCPT